LIAAGTNNEDRIFMNWKLPNQLTVGRILLAAVFFVLLGLYDAGSASGPVFLNVAFAIYILAGVTDVLDGYIARKYNWISAFGRICDPFVDKVLVVGTFVMLAGANFASDAASDSWLVGGMTSGVMPWMVVVIMAREFIVSAIRGYSESQGIQFPATSAGKIKMLLQSVAICVVLFQLANLPGVQWAVTVKVVCVWLAVIATVLSGFAYVGKARKLLVSNDE